MKMRIVVLLFMGLVLCAACRKGAPVYNADVSIPAAVNHAAGLSQDQVRKAILLACSERGWTAREVAPGQLEAKLVVRGKHTVYADIPYSASSYAIKYKSSINMEYKGKKDGSYVIHPNYNKWVHLLEQNINNNLALLK